MAKTKKRKRRKLFYIPVIHSRADLGSVAEHAVKKGEAMIGEEAWAGHERMIDGFWDSITLYFSSVNVAGFRIYQDGLAADGELGMKIVEEAARRGSKNYRLVKGLVSRGAAIVKTEDISIVKKELDFIRDIIGAKTRAEKIKAVADFRKKKDELLKERDGYIASRINNTLKEGETGILFIGSFHSITSRLSKDIEVEEVKEKAKLEEYERIFIKKSKKARAEKLAKYIASPVKPDK